MSRHRQSWSHAEDDRLMTAVRELGAHQTSPQSVWTRVAAAVGGGRTAAACQGRFNSALDPKLDTSEFTPEQDRLLLSLMSSDEFNSWHKVRRKWLFFFFSCAVCDTSRSEKLTSKSRRSAADDCGSPLVDRSLLMIRSSRYRKPPTFLRLSGLIIRTCALPANIAPARRCATDISS